jgi:hypothetical protein
MLRVFLRKKPPSEATVYAHAAADSDVEKGSGSFSSEQWEIDGRLVWTWQAPMMLRSFSWVGWLMGYELYIATPVVTGQTWTAESKVRLVIPLPSN